MQPIVEIGLAIVALYLSVGVVFSLALHAAGLKRIDAAVSGAGWFFRLLVTPGLVALWPLFAARWRHASSAGPRRGPVHRPLPAAGLRTFHRRLTILLAIVVPLLAAAGVLLRPARPLSDEGARSLLLERTQLPRVLSTHERPFGGLPIRLTVRAGTIDPRQIELEVGRDLGLPNLLIYWTEDEGSFPDDAIYLGVVWGPGTRRYAIDRDLLSRGGSLVLYTLTHQQRVATFALPEG